MVSIGYKHELGNTIAITRHRNSLASIGYKHELGNTISITRHRNSLVSIGYKYELVNTISITRHRNSLVSIEYKYELGNTISIVYCVINFYVETNIIEELMLFTFYCFWLESMMAKLILYDYNLQSKGQRCKNFENCQNNMKITDVGINKLSTLIWIWLTIIGRKEWIHK